MASSHPMPPNPAKPRVGPRPLPLHLAAAGLAWTSSLAALPLLKNGSIAWRPELKAAAQSLANELARAQPEAFAAAVSREARHRLAAFLDGLTRYRRHPYRRAEAGAPAIWREGTTRLLDYGTGENGVPLLVIPSLINRAYILDLEPERSFLRFLAGEGFRPYLVDWDAPGEAERQFSLDDYIAGRLSRARSRSPSAIAWAACWRWAWRNAGAAILPAWRFSPRPGISTPSAWSRRCCWAP